MHGDGGTGAQIRGAFGLEAAAAEGAIFAYPDGINHTWKQADKAETNEDFFFFDAVVAKTSDTYRVDTKRVFVTGFSSGAYMTNQLGCFRGGTIRAIAPMSGGGPYDAVGGHYDAEGHLTCNVKPVAAMIIHGDIDGVVPMNEGQKSLSHWSWANNCGNTMPAEGADACRSAQCTLPVTFCTVRGKGHQIWSEAPTRVWQFFSGFR
jgi:polyhydroxybutyrate depolymerase